MSPRRLLARLGVAVLGLVVLDQVALHVALRDGRLFGRAVAPFDPPVFSVAQERSLARIRAAVESGDVAAAGLRFDPELGWCNPRQGGHGEFTYDWAGCRIAAAPLPRDKTPGVRRILALGCSMTHGEEVGARETWCAMLDERRDDVEVANLGVAAYGLDQALLRYRRDGASLEPDEVWLALLPEAALRVVSVYWPTLSHWSLDVSFKPRFVLDEGGGLVPVPAPARSLAHLVRLLDDQEQFLAAVAGVDPWVARAPLAYAPRGSHPLHHSFLGRTLLSLHEAGGRDLAAHLAGPRAEVYRLLFAIVLATSAEARGQGARFRFLILPGRTDLERREATGRGSWDELCAELAAAGVEVVDLSPALEAAAVPRAVLFAPAGHYTAAGNRVVAETLAAEIDR